jgi:hypothetical protein
MALPREPWAPRRRTARGQVADSLGRIRTPVVWGQGIPLRPARTIQQIGPKRKHQAVQTTNQVSGVQTSIMSNILPSHPSVTDAVTRLQRERDLALRRIDELHVHHKKEIEKRDESDRKSTLISMKMKPQHRKQGNREHVLYVQCAVCIVRTVYSTCK